MEHNYTLRDVLQQWLRDLEAEIQKHSSAHHTLHLYELGKFATAYLSELRAMAACLEPIYDLRSQGLQEAEGPGGAEAEGSAAVGEASNGGLRGGGGQEEGGPDLKVEVMSRGGKRKVKDVPTLAYFFDNEYIFFRDLTGIWLATTTHAMPTLVILVTDQKLCVCHYVSHAYR
jgi:hypothetical protein